MYLVFSFIHLCVTKSSCMTSRHSSFICYVQNMLACMCLSKFLPQGMVWYDEFPLSDSGLVVIWFILSVLGFPHCIAVSRHPIMPVRGFLSLAFFFNYLSKESDSPGFLIKFHLWGHILVSYAMAVLNPRLQPDRINMLLQRSLLEWKNQSCALNG